MHRRHDVTAAAHVLKKSDQKAIPTAQCEIEVHRPGICPKLWISNHPARTSLVSPLEGMSMAHDSWKPAPSKLPTVQFPASPPSWQGGDEEGSPGYLSTVSSSVFDPVFPMTLGSPSILRSSKRNRRSLRRELGAILVPVSLSTTMEITGWMSLAHSRLRMEWTTYSFASFAALTRP